ncbi:hypothetical protein Selin_1434 [Desulfurispirillum indicum S5]|uniref:Uncharacterized protein n=1 Tax=Desulfurispirillum indicum (strain ATCC BAA-1389 / DSM 22839 / S5) TaxID=653733 RepID=E6W6S5_DESIS|nr:hypothetical protein [Desulfurispirillum indicum]ADU66168.1 hypothetical protein Selin_1434 [Desulfurispirillum indicum S5]
MIAARRTLAILGVILYSNTVIYLMTIGKLSPRYALQITGVVVIICLIIRTRYFHKNPEIIINIADICSIWKEETPLPVQTDPVPIQSAPPEHIPGPPEEPMSNAAPPEENTQNLIPEKFNEADMGWFKAHEYLTHLSFQVNTSEKPIAFDFGGYVFVSSGVLRKVLESYAITKERWREEYTNQTQHINDFLTSTLQKLLAFDGCGEFVIHMPGKAKKNSLYAIPLHHFDQSHFGSTQLKIEIMKIEPFVEQQNDLEEES